MARKILVTSGKGGVGKTSVCAHLGYALSSVGERVAVFDLDFGLNNLDVVMGVESKVVYDIKDVLDGKCRVKQTIIECTPRLALIPSRHTFDGQVTGQNIKLLAEGISSRFDYLFYDCPAGVEGGFHRAACAADEAILVVTPTITSLRDGDKVLSLLKNYKLKNVYAIVNRVRGDLLLSGKTASVSEIESVLKIPVIGCIPDDDKVMLSNGFILENGRAKNAFRLTAKALRRGQGKLFDPTLYYRGAVGLIRRALR